MLPELRTPRLLLRPAQEGDVTALWHLWTDPDVRRFLWDDEVIPWQRAAETVEALRASAPDGLGLWTLHLLSQPELIGCAALREANWIDGVELIIALDPTYWGEGYATEACQAMLEYAWNVLHLPYVAAGVDRPNAASHRLVRRLGFYYVGELEGPRYRIAHYRLDAPAMEVPAPGA